MVVFGTLIAAAMPILLAIVAIPVTMAVIYAIGLHTSMIVFVLNITSIIGLGISIGYSLFMIRRCRDQLAGGRSDPDAIGWAVATAGASYLFRGLVVMSGFCSLLLSGLVLMAPLGIVVSVGGGCRGREGLADRLNCSRVNKPSCIAEKRGGAPGNRYTKCSIPRDE